MELKEFYEKVGGSYDALIERISVPERGIKYLQMFKNDQSMVALRNAIEEQDFKKAFEAIHTLKGISANLSLDRFYQACCALTEIFRYYTGGDYQDALYEVENEYKVLIENIDKLN